MSAEAQPEPDALHEDDETGIVAAYERVGEALNELDMVEHSEQWNALQQRYFDLKAAILARDEEFQYIHLGGTDMYIPNTERPIGDNPTIETDIGEVEVPTRYDHFRVFGSVAVADPENPHLSHGIQIDHVIETDGSVHVQINGTEMGDLL